MQKVSCHWPVSCSPPFLRFLRLFAANPRRSDDDTPDSLHRRIQLAEHELYPLKKEGNELAAKKRRRHKKERERYEWNFVSETAFAWDTAC